MLKQVPASACFTITSYITSHIQKQKLLQTPPITPAPVKKMLNYFAVAVFALMEVRLQVTGIPVVFVSALEGKGRLAVMRQVVDTYEKWCSRLPTARLNRWLRKVC